MAVLHRLARLNLDYATLCVHIQMLVISKVTWSWAIEGLPPWAAEFKMAVARTVGCVKGQGRSVDLVLGVFTHCAGLHPEFAVAVRSLSLWVTYLQQATESRLLLVQRVWRAQEYAMQFQQTKA
eukprot:6334652-Amphidinium_carterae.1